MGDKFRNRGGRGGAGRSSRSRRDALAEGAEGLTPLAARARRLVAEDVVEGDEVAVFEGALDVAQLAGELGQQVREGHAVDDEGGQVDAEELGGLEDGFL